MKYEIMFRKKKVNKSHFTALKGTQAFRKTNYVFKMTKRSYLMMVYNRKVSSNAMTKMKTMCGDLH